MVKYLLLKLIAVYQYAISPLMAPHCRFYPSCSCYAQHAIAQHGALKGLYLTLRRLSKCHPWHDGGYDPVPEECTFHRHFTLRNSK